MTEVLDDVQRTIAIPKRFSLTMRDIWALQHRLAKRGGRRAFKILEQTKFRGAFDFLLLRAQAEEGSLTELANWWQQFQFADETEKMELINSLGREAFDKPKRRRNYKRKRTSTPDA
jgi:poly(A) polymerase